jgi:hypothetical protein
VFGAAGRCKLYRLEKGEKGTDEYKDFGSGILRLNKHKETGRRRVRGAVVIRLVVAAGEE